MSLRHFITRRIMVRLLVSVIMVRSLIAVGFMLSVSGHGLELVFCDGPVSFKPVNNDISKRHVHGEHDHHSMGQAGDSQLYISPSCSDWSTSSLLVINNSIEFITPHQVTELISPVTLNFIDQSVSSINLIRAPPYLV